MIIRYGEVILAEAPRYEPVSRLGYGTFGEVWRVRNTLTGIEKALKVLLHPAESEWTKREARALELIKNRRHPYLLAVEDYWVCNDRLHIVMELADDSLRGLLRDYSLNGCRGVPRHKLLGLLSEFAEGLDYLHANDIVHRDVKPDNLLTLHGHGKVADCGVARSSDTLNQTMSVVGTPSYMAPEVWWSEGNPASDCYGLAITYTELRQGVHPLVGRKGPELLSAHEQGLFYFDDVIGTEERSVLRRGLSRRPEERYRSCAEFVNALEQTINF